MLLHFKMKLVCVQILLAFLLQDVRVFGAPRDTPAKGVDPGPLVGRDPPPGSGINPFQNLIGPNHTLLSENFTNGQIENLSGTLPSSNGTQDNGTVDQVENLNKTSAGEHETLSPENITEENSNKTFLEPSQDLPSESVTHAENSTESFLNVTNETTNNGSSTEPEDHFNGNTSMENNTNHNETPSENYTIGSQDNDENVENYSTVATNRNINSIQEAAVTVEECQPNCIIRMENDQNRTCSTVGINAEALRKCPTIYDEVVVKACADLCQRLARIKLVKNSEKWP